MRKFLEKVCLQLPYCGTLKRIRSFLFWLLVIIFAGSNLIFGYPWTIVAMVLTTLLFITTYKRIEEAYLGRTFVFDLNVGDHILNDPIFQSMFGKQDYKFAKVVFFHRLAYSLLFIILLISFLKYWGLEVGYNRSSEHSFIHVLSTLTILAFTYIGFYQGPGEKTVLERLTGNKSRWLNRAFVFLIFLLVFYVFTLSLEIENLFLQEVANTFIITAGLIFITTSYPRIIRFFARKNLNGTQIDFIVNKLCILLTDNESAYIYDDDNTLYIECIKMSSPPSKPCRYPNCDCHLPLIDVKMIYIPHSSGKHVIKKEKSLILSQSRLQICLRRFLGEAAFAAKKSQSIHLRVSDKQPQKV